MSAHPRPWHRQSIFGDGPRVPMCRERRQQWKALLAMHERAGRITADHEKVGLKLLKRLGEDGRCDPSHATLAADTGKDISTVKRALKLFQACGLLTWARRIIREGRRVFQTSNAYMLTLGAAPAMPLKRCEVPSERQTRKDRSSSLQSPSPAAPQEARQGNVPSLATIAEQGVQRMMQKWLTRGAAKRR
jgi:hypothetical protein